MTEHSRQPTAFQEECRERTLEVLRGAGVAADFRWAGVEESYLRAVVDLAEDEYEIFIYEDEAGFFKNGSWRIWEVPDYDSGEELMRAFLTDLQSKVAASVESLGTS